MSLEDKIEALTAAVERLTKSLEITSPQPTVSSPSAESPAEAGQLDYADVAAVTTKLTRLKGRDATIAVLSVFGANNAKKLSENDWPAYIKHCENVLEEA